MYLLLIVGQIEANSVSCPEGERPRGKANTLLGIFDKRYRLNILGMGIDSKCHLYQDWLYNLNVSHFSCKWILAHYEVDTFKDVFSMEHAEKSFPEVREYDHNFDPKQHKKELEVNNIMTASL